MQRPIWKGHITFSLVNIPVVLYSAANRSHIHFHLLDSRNMAGVRYSRINDVILREALKRKKEVGIARVVIRTRQYFAALIQRDNALLLDLLLYYSEIHPLDEFNIPSNDSSKLKIHPHEIELAEQLIEVITTDWNHEQYKDNYDDSLLKSIEEKAAMKKKQPTSRISKKA